MLDKDVPITFVMRTDELRQVALARGFDALLEPAADQMVALPENALLICVDPSHGAQMARSLVEAGRSDVLVRWIDDATAPGSCEKMLDTLSPEQIRFRARMAGCDELMALADVREDPDDLERFDLGYDFLSPYMKIRRRELQIFAGPYGCGKSTISQLVGLKLALGPMCSDREVAAWFCTLEDDPVEQRDQIRRHFHHGWSVDRPPEFDCEREARRTMRRIWITRPEWSGEKRMDWWEDRARAMHRNYGTNVFILDPWAQMDHIYGGRGGSETETQYVSTVMRRTRALSQELRCVVQVITHVTKSVYASDGGIRAFRIADAMGSGHFGGNADRGICVLRTKQLSDHGDHSILHFDKVKVERTMGKAHETIALRYVVDRHDLAHDVDASSAAAEAWGSKKASNSADGGFKSSGKAGWKGSWND